MVDEFTTITELRDGLKFTLKMADNKATDKIMPLSHWIVRLELK